jgi:Pyruvate/2-oxoacid:ferredoxin oxidoreductase delta subunit
MTDESNGQDQAEKVHWLVERDMEKCSLCEVCTRSCPTGALQSEITSNTIQILFRCEQCDGCRICLDRCPEDASQLVRVKTPPDGPVVLVRSKLLHCSVCGQPFAPAQKLEAASKRRGDERELNQEQCPLCRCTQMVARFIEEKRESNGRPAEYRTGKKWHFKPVVDGDPDGPPCPEVLEEPLGEDMPAEREQSPDAT